MDRRSLLKLSAGTVAALLTPAPLLALAEPPKAMTIIYGERRNQGQILYSIIDDDGVTWLAAYVGDGMFLVQNSRPDLVPDTALRLVEARNFHTVKPMLAFFVTQSA